MKLSDALPAFLPDLGDALATAGAVFVRAAWCRDGEGSWLLRLLEIIEGPRPSGSMAGEWEYPDVTFSARDMPGAVVGSWLREGKVTTDNEWVHELSPIGRVTWERRESYAHSGYEVLPWPSYEVDLGRLDMNEPQRPLLSDKGAPSFASFYTAATAFFGLEPGQPGRSLPSFAVFRRVDTRSRVNHVKISQDQLSVEVEGTALDGLTVELAGDAPGTTATLRTKEAVTAVNFRLLPEGLPPGAWVVVRGGSEWLDRRFLAWPRARGQEAGVSVELPAMTKIDGFLAARESDTVEFKQEIPESESTRAKVMKTVCAFANGAGGSLLFGITDDYEVVGLPAAKVSRYQDTLSDLIDAWVEPTPTYSFEVLSIEGTEMAVIELIVNAGRALFGSSKPNEPRRVYIRHHSRSVPARVREIEGIVQSRSAIGISRLSPM